MSQDIHRELLAPFDDNDIEWRLQWTNEEKTNGRAVPYVTNRAIQQRLDKVVGFQNWKNEYKPWHSVVNHSGKAERSYDSQLCGISVYLEDRQEWITKYDGAEDTDIESVKGGLSDSMKRAAVQWGIGRYLYSMDAVWIKTEQRGRTAVIPDSEFARLNMVHREHVKRVFAALGKEEQELAESNQAPEQAAQQTQSVPVELPPVQTPPDNRIWVDKVATIPSVSGKNNTHLQLRDENGKTTEAYLEGEHPDIVPGTTLYNAKFTKKENQGVVFFILDSYEIFSQAA